MSRAHPLSGRPARWILLGLALALLALRAWPFTHRIFNWDELGLLSRAWVHYSEGWRSESRPGLVRLMIWPLFALSRDQILVMFGARALNAAALLGLYGGVWAVARRLYGRSAAVLALMFLSFHSLFFAHSVEVRTETFSTALTLWGVAWSEGRARRGRSVWPGIIPVALGALCSQKAIYPFLWYAVGHMVGAGSRWRIREQRGLLLALILPPLLFLGAVTIALPFAEVLPYLRRLTLGAIEEVRSPFYLDWVQWTYPKWSLEREPAFYMLPALGLPFLLRRTGRPRWRLVAAFAQQLAVGGILWFHAARFPYFSLTLAPLWAIPAGYELHLALAAAGRWGRRSSLRRGIPRGMLISAALLLLLPFYAEVRRELLRDSAESQLEMIRRLQSVFPPGTPGFDAHHLMIFHDQAATPMYSRAVAALKTEPDAMAAFVRQLREAQPVYYIQSKRTEKLVGAARRFLDDHYLRVGPNLYMPGRRLDAPGTFDVAVAGEYKFIDQRRSQGAPPPRRWPSSAVSLDGKRLRRGASVKLEIGPHQLSWEGEGGVRVRLAWPGVETIEAPQQRNWQLYRPYK